MGQMCMTNAGNAIPLFFVFAGNLWNREQLQDTTPGADATLSENSILGKIMFLNLFKSLNPPTAVIYRWSCLPGIDQRILHYSSFQPIQAIFYSQWMLYDTGHFKG